MESAQHAKPNELLRRQRQQRGWSLQRVADEIRRLCERDGRRVGITAHMVGTWERGNKKPSPLYREKLCVLYGENAERLGLIEASTETDSMPLLRTPAGIASPSHPFGPAQGPASPTGGVDEELFLDEDGTDGLEAQDSEMRRRTFLRRMAGATGAALIAPPLGLLGSEPWERLSMAIDRPATADVETVHDLETITASYARLTECVTSGSLIGPVLEHMRTITDLLRGPQPPNVRRRLCVAAADVSQLAGRLLFGIGQHQAARSYYTVSLQAAKEAGDRALGAYVIGGMSFIHTREGKPDKALHFVQQAQRTATDGAPASLRAWLLAMEAELQASLGNAKATRTALDAAERAADVAERQQTPSWIEYFDRGRLAGFSGVCHIRLGRPDDAVAPLNEALDALPETGVKHRSVLLTDLATARVKQGHLEEGCSLATESLQIATRMKGISAMRRLRDFRTQLNPWRDTREVQRFTDNLRASVNAVQVAARV
jgi:tetratricopeptide (TPR) repeat protein/transcriptional regulator with XRE-family HTH domain